MGPPRPADPHVCRPYRAAAERRRESVDPPVPGDPPDAAARAAAGGGPADPDPWDAGPGDHTHLRWVPGAARPRLSAPAGVLAAAGAAGVLLGRTAEGAAPAGSGDRGAGAQGGRAARNGPAGRHCAGHPWPDRHSRAHRLPGATSARAAARREPTSKRAPDALSRLRPSGEAAHDRRRLMGPTL